MTLLTIVQSASREMGLPVPNAVASSVDVQTQQLYGLVNALGDQLKSLDHDWQSLIAVHTFVTDASGTSDLPSDYYRQINNTHWDRSDRWRLIGPVLPAGWQWLKSSSLANTGPRVRFRIQDDVFNYHPDTDTGNTFAYEYIKDAWVVDGDDSSEKSSFTKDNDTCVFRDRLLIDGLKMKFYEAKGFDTAAYSRDFAIMLETAISQDAGAPTLSLSGPNDVAPLLDYWNIPDSGYGS